MNVSLVDAQQDHARALQSGAVAVAWSQDGQALALSDISGYMSGASGNKVWLVTPSSGASITLPEPVVAFIGFVRTVQPQ
jgi:hypothetical protein